MTPPQRIPPSSERKRFRELGLSLGRYPTGEFNAITDVPGVQVGFCTLTDPAPRARATRLRN